MQPTCSLKPELASTHIPHSPGWTWNEEPTSAVCITFRDCYYYIWDQEIRWVFRPAVFTQFEEENYVWCLHLKNTNWYFSAMGNLLIKEDNFFLETSNTVD